MHTWSIHLGIKSTLQVQRWRQSARPHRAGHRCGLDVGGGSAFGTLAEAQRMGGENNSETTKNLIEGR